MSNLPPGVSDHMIPGNRPEDMLEEAFWELLQEKYDAAHPQFKKIMWEVFSTDESNLDDAITALVTLARDIGYERGFAEGRQEEQMAEAEVRVAKQRLHSPTKAELRDFEDAHSQGWHDDIPREFCPLCRPR